VHARDLTGQFVVVRALIVLGVGIADTDLAEFVLIYQCLCCYNFSQEYTTKCRKIQDVS